MKILVILFAVMVTLSVPKTFARQPRGFTPQDMKVSMDARWSKFGAFLAETLNKVQDDWMAHRSPSDATIVVIVKAEIHPDGRVQIVKAECRSSNTQRFVDECTKVIAANAPYAPWTNEMIASLGKAQQIEFRFSYKKS